MDKRVEVSLTCLALVHELIEHVAFTVNDCNDELVKVLEDKLAEIRKIITN